MAIFRQVHTDFWIDSKVQDTFTANDRYFMLFLLTNPATNMIGCYEMSKKNIAYYMGFDHEKNWETKISTLIDRFVRVHKIIMYDEATKEILILNWAKFNWANNPKYFPKMKNELQNIKSSLYRDILSKKLSLLFKTEVKIDSLSIPYQYPIDSLTRVENENENDKENENENDKDILSAENHQTEHVSEIISYLNKKTNSKFKHDTPKTVKTIKARFNEGFKEEDFISVINIKTIEWLGTDMEQYLRPETLFGTKFESYLNQKSPSKQEPTKKRGLSDATAI